MKKSPILRVIALLVTLTLLGAACGGSPTNAATVNGDAISKSEVTDELEALIAAVDSVPESQLSATDRASLLDQLMDAERKSPSSSAAADLLTNKIIGTLVEQALKQFGLTVEDEDTKAAEADIAQSLYNYAADDVRRAAVDDGARTSRLSRFLEDPANKWYTDADVEAFYEAGKKDRFLGEACTAHILVADEALANKLLADIRAGADFAAVAAANSTDASNKDTGGDLGCNAKGSFVPEFEAAVIAADDGDLIGPVKTQYGYHVIKVGSTYKVRPLDDALKAEIASLLAQPRGWLDFTLGKSTITVNRQFGTWDAKQMKVVPPEGAASGPTGK